jgi:hypothetical protein
LREGVQTQGFFAALQDDDDYRVRTLLEGLGKVETFPRRLKPQCNKYACGGNEVPHFQTTACSDFPLKLRWIFSYGQSIMGRLLYQLSYAPTT